MASEAINVGPGTADTSTVTTTHRFGRGLALALVGTLCVAGAVLAAAGSSVVAHGTTPHGSPWRLSAAGRMDGLCLTMAAQFASPQSQGTWQRLRTCGVDASRSTPLGASMMVGCPEGAALIYGVVPAGVSSVQVKPTRRPPIAAMLYRASVGFGGRFAFYVAETPTSRPIELVRSRDRHGRTVDLDRLGENGRLCDVPSR
jgi:hypothetical protein